jgi:hypothetical protein
VIKLTIQYDPSGKEKKNVHIISEKEVVHLLQIHVIDVLNIPDLILKLYFYFMFFIGIISLMMGMMGIMLSIS